MRKEGIIEKFTQSFLALTRVAVGVQDDFFAEKIKTALQRLASCCIQYESIKLNSPSRNVAQYIERDFIAALDYALEVIEDLHYLEKAAVAPLLDAQKEVLELKLEILRPAKSMSDETEVSASTSAGEASLPSIPVSAKIPRSLNPNQERILKFLTTAQAARTKDIVDEFSSLSERTVKRSLKELVTQGLVKRRSENKAVFYSPII